MRRFTLPVRQLRVPITLLVLLALVFTPFPPPQDASAALDTEPTRKAEIKIQSSKVDATLTDFPVLLTEDTVPSEACDADGTSPAQSGGGDIRFTSDEDGNTQLPLEVIDFTTNNNPANCTVEMYVKVASVSSTTDTSIWMWYNTTASDTQPAASSTYGSENVWDSSYKGVWHLGESSGARSDATANGNDLTDNNTVSSATGKWGTAADFEKDNSEYLSITDATQTGLDITGDFTASAWVKMESDPNSGGMFIWAKWDDDVPNKGPQVLHYDTVNNSVTGVDSSDGSATFGINGASSISTGTWAHVVYVFDAGTESEIYINGQSDVQVSHSRSSSNEGGGPVYIGAVEDNGGVKAGFFDGLLQDVRVSAGVRSADWIKASYNNQNDPSTFAIEQAPQEGTSGPAEASVIKGADESVTSSTTLQDDDDFSFTLKANTEYVISSAIFATSTSANPDIKIGYTVPTGTTMDIGYLAQGGNTRKAELLETSGTASARIPIPANNNTIIQAFGSVTTGSTAGTLKLQWAQAGSNASATKVKQGSFMTVTEVTE